MINSSSGISAYMLYNKYTIIGWIQGIDSNEIFHRLIKWGNPKFDQNPKKPQCLIVRPYLLSIPKGFDGGAGRQAPPLVCFNCNTFCLEMI